MQPRAMPNHTRLLTRAISFASALVLVVGIIVAALLALPYRWDWKPVWEYRRLLADGWLATLGISAIALPLSCVLGLLFALARRSAFLPLRYFSRIYVELTRGAPLLVQIYLYFYVFANALHVHGRYVVGPLILAAFTGAYISEIIRAGIEGIGRAAAALMPRPRQYDRQRVGGFGGREHRRGVPHEHADAVVSLLDEQRGGDARIDATRHRHHDAATHLSRRSRSRRGAAPAAHGRRAGQSQRETMPRRHGHRPPQ